MKLTIVLLTAGLLQVHAAGYSQTVTLSGKDMALKEIFTAIKEQTGYVAFYNRNILGEAKPITCSVTNMPLEEFLQLALKDQPFIFQIADKTILISQKPAVTPPATPAAGPAAGALAEDPVYRGKVLNEQAQPMEGASVMIKGTHKGTYTDRNGLFELKGGVTIGTVLVISYTGYVSQEVTVKSLEPISKAPGTLMILAVLRPSTNELDEMQVVAYGKVSKRFNTGDETVIKSEDIDKNPVNNVLEAIQGHVPGMQIQQSSGAPGSNFIVQVRGESSFGITQPLYVIDGVVYPATTALSMLNPLYNSITYGNNTGLNGISLNGTNALDYVDPSLIESVSVLKDADATSIYGSRGAYGVILITTKKGKPGVPRLNVNTYTGVTTRGVTPQLLNTRQYLMLRREALKNDGLTPGTADDDLNGTWDTTASTNWRNFFLGHAAVTTTTSANYSGGIGNTSYLIGASYRDQSNIQRNIGRQTSGGLNFNLNTGTQKFNVTLSGSFSSTVNNMLPADLSGEAASLAPNHPSLYLPNGQINWNYYPNPVGVFNDIYNNVVNNLLTTAIFRYSPVKGLTFSASVGYSYLTLRELYAVPSTAIDPLIYTNPGQAASSQMQWTSTTTVNFDPYVDYVLQFGGKNKLDITAGADAQSGMQNVNSISGSNYSTDALIRDPTAGIVTQPSYATNPNRQLGYFARINYIWDQKYILNLSGRYDGSTKFGPDSRFGTFGSVGAAWLFTEEPWVKSHLPWLNFGKLRGSYGTTGGDQIPNYLYLSDYAVGTNGYQGGLTVVPGNIANPNLHWETNTKKEIALELHFLKDRIWIESDYYNQRSSDQLINMPVSFVTGFGGIRQNSPAKILNQGVEGQLTTVNVRSKNFTWKTIFNISVNRNKLLSYPGTATEIAQNTNWILGKSLQNLKLYKYDGVDPQTGQYFYTNAKGTTGNFTYLLSPTQLTQADKIANVDLTPKYYGGISNSFTYKGLTLDVFFSFMNRVGLNYYAQQLFLPGLINNVGTTQSLDRWQKPGDHAALPKLTTNAFSNLLGQYNFISSTGAYSNATYARLQNLSLSYMFQPAVLKKAHISALTVYLKGQNLLTISKYKGLDPENMSASALGPLRVYTGGINITL